MVGEQGTPTAARRRPWYARAGAAVWRLLRRDVTGRDRGVALLLALTTVAILAAFSVEFSYNMRISVHQSTNMKKEVQAYYNARSAMEIARGVIFAQKRFQQMLGPLGGNIQNLELWRYSCNFAEIFATGRVQFLGKELFSLKSYEGVGIENGGFSCEIEPEDGRVNVSRAANQNDKSVMFRKIYALLRRYFGLETIEARDREATELVLNIIDWVDADDARSDIDETGKVIDAGGAGERDYRKYGYEARNAKPDTNAELRLIEGMTDALYCDIASKLTVYETEKLNVNTADIEVLKALICEYVEGDMRAVCGASGMGDATVGYGFASPIDYVGELIETCRQIKGFLLMPAFSSPQQFVQIFGKLPAPLNTLVRVNQQQLLQEVGTKARVLRVRTTGTMGHVRKALEAVIDSGGGNYIYWNES
jgi:type II secretory pathway component PulK